MFWLGKRPVSSLCPSPFSLSLSTSFSFASLRPSPNPSSTPVSPTPSHNRMRFIFSAESIDQLYDSKRQAFHFFKLNLRDTWYLHTRAIRIRSNFDVSSIERTNDPALKILKKESTNFWTRMSIRHAASSFVFLGFRTRYQPTSSSLSPTISLQTPIFRGPMTMPDDVRNLGRIGLPSRDTWS